MVEVNYKKKYALMPLKEFSGFDKVTGEQIISPYAYIVGECYLINEIINNRNNRKYYEVVFVTGKNYYDEYKKIKVTSNVKIVPYLENMAQVLKKTDLTIQRQQEERAITFKSSL